MLAVDDLTRRGVANLSVDGGRRVANPPARKISEQSSARLGHLLSPQRAHLI
jgi:hypothetical protein